MTPQFVPSWRFNYEGLAGYVCGGHEHGVELTCGIDKRPVTRCMCLNLEHYYAKSCRGGRFVPRGKATVRAEQISDNTIRVEIDPWGHWNLTATITYTLMPDRIIEATFDFAFGTNYEDFEAFVSNYFHAPTEPHVHLGGAWTQPRLGEREHRYWPRSERDGAVVQDGRLDEFIAGMKEPYEVPVDPLCYDYPVMVTPIGDSRWSVVHIVQRKMCPTLSANRTWHAHDFSLVGHDVCEGDQLSCRAWMAYAKLESLDDALSLHKRLDAEGA